MEVFVGSVYFDLLSDILYELKCIPEISVSLMH